MLMKSVLKVASRIISTIIFLKNKLIWKCPASPEKIIFVEPEQIKRSIEFTEITKQKRNYLNGIIADGDWGECNYLIDKLHSGLFKSFKEHYKNSVPFEETNYIKNKGNGDVASLAKKYKLKYDPIYHQIKREGFRIPSTFDSVDPFKVSIASNGDILFMTGKHRLAIAKALENKISIPAKVSHRHIKWQEFRDKLYMDLKKGKIDKEYILNLSHPDLYDLVEYF